MISVLAAVDQYLPWTAIFIGCISGMNWIFWSRLLRFCNVQDLTHNIGNARYKEIFHLGFFYLLTKSLSIFATHFGGGLAGILLAPVFSKDGVIFSGCPGPVRFFFYEIKILLVNPYAGGI